MKFARLEDLPEKHLCLLCTEEKPIAKMMLVRNRKTGTFKLRPRCKQCNNTQERGHRREYKRDYLRRWRRWNPELNDSYTRERQTRLRKELSARAHVRFLRDHDAILIQGRLRRRMGMHITIAEARDLCARYGRCYPTPAGLTPDGHRECERIRSRMRRNGKNPNPVEIRMMVYEDGFYITPSRQPLPYPKKSRRFKRWWSERKEQEAA